ncbi:unnamed protein product [Orchesella dallaii]|uniref:Gustatory receptor n=1 Tax=Orchesella dallaii TaxID=48710 RepID=A0ABP1PME3_9HEXA
MKSSGHRELKSNWFQKILCYTVWTLAIINRVTDIRRNWQDERKHRTIFYFKFTHHQIHTLLNLLFYFTLITKLDKIKEMMEIIGHSKLLHPTPRYRWIICIFCLIIWMVFGFMGPIVGYEVELTRSYNWASPELFRVYVAQAKYTFFLETNSTLAKLPVESHEMGGTSCFLGILQIFITLAHNLQLSFTICLFTVCSLSLWSASTRFIEEFVGKKFRNRDEFYEGFQELWNVSRAVNSVWSLFCFWYLMDILAWLSTELDTGLMAQDWFVKIHIFYYLTCLGAAVMFSAESYRKMQRLRLLTLQKGIIGGDIENNMQNKRNGENEDFEMAWSTICIGASGFYKINYRFIGKITATIITFFIISVEYTEDKKGVGNM